MGKLDSKVAVITGTAGGQGRAAAIRFAAEGARVVGCDIEPDGAAQTVETVSAAGGEMVSLHPCNLTDPADAASLMDLADTTYGGIDILYNNAGAARMVPIADMTFEDFDFTIDHEVNLIFHAVKAAWQRLIDRGGGSIINTGSVSGSRVYKVLPGLAHSAAKGAVIAMTRQMALEGGQHGIRANTISPGLIEVPMTAALLQHAEFREPMVDKLMLSRWGQPDDVAGAAVFLASEDAAWITGIDLLVDGGTCAW
jgi:NAD(P)-dependent dehydrogenase (short-subunit alcohol dehydrogenase family)